MNKKAKIALVLGGGGARGLAHVGVLRTLKKHKIDFDFIVGTSMGAAVGACFAFGLSAEELYKEAINTRKRDIFRLMDLGRPGKSLMKGAKVFDYIKNIIKDQDFKDTCLPFYAVATNLETGELEVLGSGSVAKAVQASVSVPGIFPPVQIDGKYLIDGGVVNPTPIDVAKDKGADIIIAVDLVMRRDIKLDNPGVITTLMQSYEIIRTQAVKSRLDKANKRTILIRPEVGGVIESFKFADIPMMIEEGEKAAEKMIFEIKNRIKNFNI